MATHKDLDFNQFKSNKKSSGMINHLRRKRNVFPVLLSRVLRFIAGNLYVIGRT